MAIRSISGKLTVGSDNPLRSLACSSQMLRISGGSEAKARLSKGSGIIPKAPPFRSAISFLVSKEKAVC
jgi:hypothetical protein